MWKALVSLVLVAQSCSCDTPCDGDCDCVGAEVGDRPDCSGEPRCFEGACDWECAGAEGPESCAAGEVWVEEKHICSALARCE